MGTRTILAGLAIIALILAVAAIALTPGDGAPAQAAAPITDATEYGETIAAMGPPKRERPVIAVVALNAATELGDFLSVYGVLAHADVAEIVAVAEKAAPIKLEPLGYGAPFRLYSATLWVEPQATMTAFDRQYPDGADYVVVPAIETHDDPTVTEWIAAQHRKGAKIVSVCNGALTLAAAGLLDERQATAHWSGVPLLQQEHPAMQWARDRRYVVDDGIVTTTGITAALPAMTALVEAIAGREKAEQLAAELGLAHWDSRHHSSAFQLTNEHRKTFVRNTLTFWRHETAGIPIDTGVDEVALGLMADAQARTGMTRVVTIGANGGAIRSRHGLMIRPEVQNPAQVDFMLPLPQTRTPALAIERALARIARRYDRPTAEFVALVMEYPWAED